MTYVQYVTQFSRKKKTMYTNYTATISINYTTGSQTNTGLTDQGFFIHWFVKNFLTVQHALSTAASSIRMGGD